MLRPCVAGVRFAPRGAFGHNQPNKEAVARLVWFRRKTDMDMTKFFTEQVMSDSRGEASTRPPARNRGTIMTPMTFRFESCAWFRCPSVVSHASLTI